MEARELVQRINLELEALDPTARMPESAVLPEFATVRRLAQQQIDERIPERPPFNYFLRGAVVCNGNDGSLWVCAPCRIPLEKCDGHFPEFPMVPLHVLGGAMALTSALLVGHYMHETFPAMEETVYPLAIEGRQVSWTGGSRVLVPPLTAVITAELLGYDAAQNRASTRTKVWSGDRAVALIDPLEFTVLPRRFFSAMYRRSLPKAQRA